MRKRIKFSSDLMRKKNRIKLNLEKFWELNFILFNESYLKRISYSEKKKCWFGFKDLKFLNKPPAELNSTVYEVIIKIK